MSPRHALLLAAALLLGLVPLRSGEASPGSVLIPLADRVALRDAPSPAAPVLQVLEPGDRLLEFRRRDGWIEVAVFGAVGLRGWLRSSEVTLERPAPPPAKPTPPEAPPRDDGVSAFTLDIGGTPAMAFRASCRLVAGDEEDERISFSGLAPDRAVAEAAAISCTVRKTDAFGRLEVALRVERQTVAAARTTAAYNWVRVRSAGPWGGAAGWRGSVGLVIPREPGPAE